MLKKIILSLSLLFCPLVALADQIKLNDGAPKTHVVLYGIFPHFFLSNLGYGLNFGA
jgi:hypothetical protein